MITDRLSGAFFFLTGLALYFYVIPNYVDRINYGALHPDTVPNAVSVLLAICGAGLIVKPTGQHAPDGALALRAGCFMAVLVGAIWVMSKLGFLYTASPLALVLMVMIGEKRPLWIGIGVVAVPFLIWLAVDIGLDRPLP